ncbi:uncharacterized protein G6M90_00g034200 [Metarhizium brunneum]|uniref:Uncharacterized protein n=1 Tax=Metarhizium brunneum TaxID=500148 RepID=A0A7D5UV09_9HYPO|nr:hypothetical protein G6M90_00g034200 [Metarhizium brunneum]
MSICCPVGFTSALEAVAAQRQNTIPADGDIEKTSIIVADAVPPFGHIVYHHYYHQEPSL